MLKAVPGLRFQQRLEEAPDRIDSLQWSIGREHDRTWRIQAREFRRLPRQNISLTWWSNTSFVDMCLRLAESFTRKHVRLVARRSPGPGFIASRSGTADRAEDVRQTIRTAGRSRCGRSRQIHLSRQGRPHGSGPEERSEERNEQRIPASNRAFRPFCGSIEFATHRVEDGHPGWRSPCRARPEPIEQRLGAARGPGANRSAASCPTIRLDHGVNAWAVRSRERFFESTLLRADGAERADGQREVLVELQDPAQFGFGLVDPAGVSETDGKMVAV